MNRRIFIQVSIPAVIIGLLLFITCLVNIWHVNHLQENLTKILAEDVSSLEAAHQLEHHIRQLRFHSYLSLIDSNPELMQRIGKDQQLFEEWLDRAEEVAITEEEQVTVQAIKDGYHRYQGELTQLREEVRRKSTRRDFYQLVQAHPLRYVVDPCHEYAQQNENLMSQVTQESRQVSQRSHLAMLLLGLGGPLAGLVCGYGISRGLSQSLYRLNVRVQDMTHHLERDVAALNLTPGGDLRQLDEQLERVVRRVVEVVDRLHRQEREMLRAQQLATVGQLAASVAHEVRNPLTAIKLLVEAGLRENKPRPFTPEKLKIVHGEILRLEQRVQGFLNFARPPALKRHTGDLREVVAQSVELIRGRARQQQVRIQVQAPDRPLPGLVDHGQLCTVVVNLLLNAVDVMPRGGDLGIHLEQLPGGGATLSVTDTGGGICPKVASRLFEPFASAKPTGSGLGLSICKHIIEEHGGGIAGCNRPEGGARFTITLPESATGERDADTACS